MNIEKKVKAKHEVLMKKNTNYFKEPQFFEYNEGNLRLSKSTNDVLFNSPSSSDAAGELQAALWDYQNVEYGLISRNKKMELYKKLARYLESAARGHFEMFPQITLHDLLTMNHEDLLFEIYSELFDTNLSEAIDEMGESYRNHADALINDYDDLDTVQPEEVAMQCINRLFMGK